MKRLPICLLVVFFSGGLVGLTDEQVAMPRRADDLLRQALAAELAGDNQTREVRLHEALKADPDSADVRWHLGYVRDRQAWRLARETHLRAENDKDLIAYVQLRRRLEGRPAGELRLAQWCRNRGLESQSRAHWYQVLQASPRDKRALKALGLQWRDGQLVLNSQVAAEDAAERDGKQTEEEALKEYRQHLREWRRLLVGGDAGQREDVLRELRSVPDHVAVLLIGDLLVKPNDDEALTTDLQREAMILLGDMKDTRTARLLAAFAALSPDSEVREAAIEALRLRPKYQYVPALLSGMITPMELGVATAATEGGVVSRYSFEREGPQGQVFYAHLTAQRRLLGPQNIFGGYTGTPQRAWFPERVGLVPTGCGSMRYVLAPAGYQIGLANIKPVFLPNPEFQSRKRASIQGALQTGRAVQAQVDQLNQMTGQQNQQIAAVLTQLTGVSLKPDPRECWDWWQDYIDARPEVLHEAFQQGMTVSELALRPTPMSLAEGTLVWTSNGRLSIQQLRVSDLVLAQHPETGELTYKPVLAVAIAESPTLRLQVSGETITCSPGQAFWRAGEAWWRGCDLQPTHSLHGLTGSAAVRGKADFVAARSYQLIIGEYNNFFVGTQGLLVHDGSTPRPTKQRLPGYGK